MKALECLRTPAHRSTAQLLWRALVGIVLAGLSPMVMALDIQPYSAERLAQLQTAGKAVGVHFHAEWCGTCKTQEKALQAIKSEGSLPGVALLVADYDKEKELRKQMMCALSPPWSCSRAARRLPVWVATQKPPSSRPRWPRPPERGSSFHH